MRQFRVTVRLHVPLRSPVSWWTFQLGTSRSSSALSISCRKVTMLRTFSTTDGDKPEVSLRSINRRSPRWSTFRIFMSNSSRRGVICQATVYGPDCLIHVPSASPEVPERWVFSETGPAATFLFSLRACKRFWCLSQIGKKFIALFYLRWTVALVEDSPQCCNLALPISLESSF